MKKSIFSVVYFWFMLIAPFFFAIGMYVLVGKWDRPTAFLIGLLILGGIWAAIVLNPYRRSSNKRLTTVRVNTRGRMLRNQTL